MFGWLTERRRAKLIEQPFPPEWNAILDDNVAIWRRLDDAEHPLVMRTLVALGVLEALDSAGRVRVTGGPLEEAVLLARQRWRARSGSPRCV